MKTFVAPLVGVFLLLGVIYGARQAVPERDNPDNAVVMVKLGEDDGTGVYIGNNQFLTAAHVTAEATDGKVTLVDPRGHEYVGTVVWQDSERDVALISTNWQDPTGGYFTYPTRGVQQASLACELPDAKVGEAVVSIGYPLNLGKVKTWGRIASRIGDFGALVKRQLADITIAPGNSGGPLFDNIGRIVGLSEALPGIGFTIFPIDIFVPRSTICTAIKEHTQQVAENSKGN